MAELPANPIELEQVIVSGIRDLFMSVPLIAAGYAKVEIRERFPDSDVEDIEISTVPDPAQDDLRITSLIQIGIPTVSEKPYTSEQSTQLTFVYPITFDMSVKDKWDNADSTLVYTDSRALFMAIYMSARAVIKATKIIGGFENCEHEYLQQENASTVADEETGDQLHVADWSLTVHAKGITT